MNKEQQYQRLTKKGFRYEDLYITDNSAPRIKEYSKFAAVYNRLAELEDKIEGGTLVTKYSVVESCGTYCVCSVDTENLPVIDEYETEEEAKRKLEELQK